MEIIIIGAGDIGFHLTKRLAAEKHNITVIEYDKNRVMYAHEHLDARIVEGMGTSFNTLKEADIKRAEVFAAMTNNDEVNLLACAIAKKAGVPMTIARIRNPEYTAADSILSPEELGVDYVIKPEKLTAKAIVRLIRQSSATDVLEFDEGKIRLFGIRLEENCPVLHRQLKDLARERGNPHLRILAIKRMQYTIIPKGDDLLLKGDQIYIVCEKDYLPEALRYFGKSDVKVENIMIIGGGLVGRYVAEELEKEINIKIIETDENKSTMLAGLLKNSLIIHGDGSDLDLLTFEGLQDMDEFVAVSGDDETNIITSLVAQHLKVPRTITLLRKPEYIPLTPAIGMDAVISKQQITVNSIQKLIRGKEIAYYAELPNLDAEIVEFIAKPGTKIVRKPLKDINFPKKAIVGSVLKNNERLEIPRGDTQIEPGDKVIIFSLPEEIRNVEKLF